MELRSNAWSVGILRFGNAFAFPKVCAPSARTGCGAGRSPGEVFSGDQPPPCLLPRTAGNSALILAVLGDFALLRLSSPAVDAHASAGAGGGVPPSGFRFSTVRGFGGNYLFPPITARPARNFPLSKNKKHIQTSFPTYVGNVLGPGACPRRGVEGARSPLTGFGTESQHKGGMGCCGKLSGAGRRWGRSC